MNIFDQLFEYFIRNNYSNSRISYIARFSNICSNSNIDGFKKFEFEVGREPYSNIIRESNISTFLKNQLILLEYRVSFKASSTESDSNKYEQFLTIGIFEWTKNEGLFDSVSFEKIDERINSFFHSLEVFWHRTNSFIHSFESVRQRIHSFGKISQMHNYNTQQSV